MSTLSEIEKAIEQLSAEQWLEIRQWMDTHSPKATPAKIVDWTRSAGVMRHRAAETQLTAATVMDALSALRQGD